MNMPEINVRKWLDSPSYQAQKEVINREVNTPEATKPSYAHISLQAPKRYIIIDRSVFVQSPTDRGAALMAKEKHRESLRQVYGKNWKKHLNTPGNSLSSPIHMTF